MPEVSGGGVVPRVTNPVPMNWKSLAFALLKHSERLYLVAAVAPYSMAPRGMAVQIAGLRPQVIAWRRGHQRVSCFGSKGVTKDAHPIPSLPKD